MFERVLEGSRRGGGSVMQAAEYIRGLHRIIL